MMGDGAWGDGWDAEHGLLVPVDAWQRDTGGTLRDAGRVTCDTTRDTPSIASRALLKENCWILDDERNLGDDGFGSISQEADQEEGS